MVFDEPGIVRVFCEMDPDELGYVVVTPNHAFVRPDARGAFKLPPLPQGDYTVTAWHPRYGKISRALLVPKRGDVQLTLAFPIAWKPETR